jgi:regulatory protein
VGRSPRVRADRQEARAPAVLQADDGRRAYVAGLRLLAGRELSGVQVRDRLLQRGFAAGMVEQAVDRLARDGALDDRRVARLRAQGALARGRGRARALLDVRRAGIDPAVAADAVREVFDAVDERAAIEQILDRRARSARIGSPADFRRLYAFLLRRGFQASDVMAVLRARARPGAAPDD